MAYVIAGTISLCIWIILWSVLPISGFDALLSGMVAILLVAAWRNVAPYLSSRKDK
jgi:hypothetical protein